MVVLVVVVVIVIPIIRTLLQVVLVGEGQVMGQVVVVEEEAIVEEVEAGLLTLPRTKRSAVVEEVLILPHRPRIPRCLWEIRGMAW